MRGVAEYAPVSHRVQQEAFVEVADVAFKEEEELAPWLPSSPLPAFQPDAFSRFVGEKQQSALFVSDFAVLRIHKFGQGITKSASRSESTTCENPRDTVFQPFGAPNFVFL